MTSYHGENETTIHLCGSCPDYTTIRAERETAMLRGEIKKRIYIIECGWCRNKRVERLLYGNME